MMFNRGYGTFGRGFDYGYNNMHNGYGWVMIVGAVLITALIVITIVALVKRSGRSSNTYDESVQMLNERFAKGEITEEEYSRMKKVLRIK